MSAIQAAPVETEIPLPRLVGSLTPVTDALDRATPEARVNWMRSLGGREQRALWELAKGTTLTVADFLAPDGSVLIGEGKNALPVFSWFQKRFARVGDELVGYNHNSKFLTFFAGPGHFVFYDSPEVPGEVWVDYRVLPKQRHPDFPELVTNDRWIIPKLVFGGMVDKMRRVSQHVVIGDAFAGTEKSKGVGFMLTLPPRHG